MAKSKTATKQPAEQEIITKAEAEPVKHELAQFNEGRQVEPSARMFLEQAQGIAPAPPKIPLLGIDHKEAQFVLPSGEVVDSVNGFPVYYFNTRGYYKAPPRAGEKGKPPDCWSPDMLAPSPQSTDKQCDTCAECPHNQFGTARDGRGKACSTKTWLFLVNPLFGDIPIAVLVLPPSSLRVLFGTRFQGGFLQQMSARYGAYQVAWVKWRLKPEGDPRSVQYCVIDPEPIAAANERQAEKLIEIHNKAVSIMNDMRGMTPQVSSPEE